MPAIDLLLAASIVSYAAIYLSWLLLHWGPATAQTAIGDAIYLPLDLLVVVISLRAAHVVEDRSVRRAWLLLAAGFAAYGLGDLAWFLMEAVADLAVPTPSVADIGYFLWYPFMAAALLALPRSNPGNDRTRVLDLAIVCTSAAAAIWWLVVGPVAAAAGSDLGTTLIALLYPVLDIVLLSALAAAMLGRVRGVPASALLLLAGGFIFNIVADLAYARLALQDDYVSGGWIDVAYMLGWLSLGLAGIAQLRSAHARSTPAGVPFRRSVGALPYLATGVVLGLVAIADLRADRDTQVLVIGAIAVTSLVSARQWLTARENTRLLARQLDAEARTAEILRKATDAVVVVDRAGTIAWATPSAAALARAATPLPGRRLDDLLQPADVALVGELLQSSVEPGGTTRTVPGHAAADGDRELEVEMTNLLDDPLVGGVVVTLRDVTERRAFEAELRSLALHDPLTGLANRVLFGDRVEQALSRARRRRTRPAVLYLDLDDFKTVNDTLGHEAGDEVLVEVARRIRRVVREGDTAARLGGDEFGVLVDDTVDVEDAVAIAERLRKVLAEPMAAGGRLLTVAASVGIVRSEERNDDKTVLLRNADIAMYEAKRETPGRHQVFTPVMYQHTVDRVRLEGDLRGALDGGQLEVVYQPLVALDGQRLMGMEALLRWRHPSRGMLLPAAFVPIAEAAGLIGSIGSWVLEEACRTVGRWNAAADGPPLRANVNVSVRQLEPGFVDDVMAILERTGFPAGLLALEITESVFAAESSALVDVVRELRDRGVRIAIDDFGTGYSSLSYLRDLPVDELKIDRSFIASMDPTAEHGLVATIIRIGHDLGLATVAEGIETTDQLEQLRRMGCTVGQGYLLGRPTAPELIDLPGSPLPPVVHPATAVRGAALGDALPA